MITVTRLDPEGRHLLIGGEELLGAPGLVWIDVEGPSEELLWDLAGRFQLHPLAVEDCLHLDQRPKLEEYPGHHFLVVHGFTAHAEDPCALTLHELHMFVRPDWLMSVHEHPIPALQAARKRLAADPGNTFARGVDFAIYAVADALVDENFEIIDRIDGDIETLEEEIVDDPDTAQLAKMTWLRRGLVTLRRVLSPQRDTLSLLARGGLPFVQERTVPYFRDVFDHLTRLHEQIEAARDLLSNARDAWLSMVANRTNEVNKQLTIIATIFLPLSFLTGFFGQNFEVLSKPVFFWLMLTLTVAVPVALLFWFRHKRWI
jgi:magnesium transporter